MIVTKLKIKKLTLIIYRQEQCDGKYALGKISWKKEQMLSTLNEERENSIIKIWEILKPMEVKDKYSHVTFSLGYNLFVSNFERILDEAEGGGMLLLI